MSTYKTSPILIPAIQQRSHKDLLTTIQVDEAKKMGITNMTTNNTQYDLLKLVKFQVSRIRHTSKYIRNLTHKHGRIITKVILNKVFVKYGHI
jgi:hypothetical protein